MITFRDSLKLAYTKIRTRRIRLIVVLFISSLLFSGLIAGSLVVSGALNSFREFSDEGYTGRYLISGSFTDNETSGSGGIYNDPTIIARAEVLEKDEIAKKKAEAKRLGIEYTESETDKAVNDDGNGNKFINFNTPSALQAIREYNESKADKVDLTRFKQQLGNNADEYYQSLSMPFFGGTNRPTLSVIADGKEKTDQNKNNFGPGMTRGVEGITQSWTLMDDKLLTPFLLKDQSLAIGQDGSIPIIASYSAAQEILKLSPLDNNVPAEQKKQRLSDVRSKIAGTTFQICYRNTTSYSSLQETIQQQTTIQANQNKKDYQKPDLINSVSSKPCEAPVVQRDVRTAEVKKYAQKQAEFDRIFGKADPQSSILTFRIVGLSPDVELPTGSTVQQILSTVLASNVGSGWASPMNVKDKIAVAEDIFREEPLASLYSPQTHYYAEYHTAELARNVLKEKNCIIVYQGMPTSKDQVACTRANRPFSLQSFGSASLAIDQFKEGFRQVQLVVAGGVGLLASIILMGMVGRIIADARKETAVFRAIGASRLAISQIYVTYTLYLALFTIIIASIIGFGAALWVDYVLSPDMSVTMALLFNATDLSQKFHFYSFGLYDIGLIAAVIVIASIIGSLVPISHNVRRNPIKDMRED